MTVTCPLKEYGCKETKEMTREECNTHLSSGLFNHILFVATAMTSGSLESSANLVQSSKEGDHGPEVSQAGLRRYVGTFGFLDDRAVGMKGRGSDEIVAMMQSFQATLTGLQDKVAQLEKTDCDLLDGIQANAASLDKNIFVVSKAWNIPQFSQCMDDARTGKCTSMFSPSFYSNPTSRCGYKMCLRLYILGDGEFDNILQWPFTHKVTLKLINQYGGRDVIDLLQPDPLSSSFQKPKSDMNAASGCPRFVSIDELMEGGFIVDDTIFIKVETSCGHWLCDGCAKELFDRKESTIFCPRTDCGEELTTEEGRPFFPDRFVRKEINRFSIMCRNRKLGCHWSGKIDELLEHLRSCVYEIKKEECSHCKEGFSLSEYQSHVDQCPKMTVACPLKDHGCKETKEMTREECIEHLSSKDGLFNHIVMMFAALFSLSTGPLKSESGGSDSKYCSALPTAPRRYVSTDEPSPSPGPGSDLGYLEDGVAGAVGGGRYGDMGGGRVDNKLMSLVMTKITGIQAELTKKDSQIHTLQDKVAQLETTLSTKMSENEDRDFRLSLMENSNFDGSMVWKIPQFSQRMDDARTGKYASIFSLPFYFSRYGYKMCLRLYILGDGIGKGTHMSLFFVVMKGEFDNILQWPFTHKVTFKLINQCGARDIIDIFQPDPLSSSFQKPKSDMNVASGCPRFVSMNELMQGGFIVDDTIFIKVKVDTATMRHP
uniref:MATH domain-containing protein n=2 Tax=Amphimedon queenslandica TaxID=400682 RepID=A0A1X7T9H5_AMPQE